MDERQLIGPLNEIVDGMLGAPRPTGMIPRLPFDIEAPNQHPSKKEFLQEQAVAQTCHDHLSAIVRALVPDEITPEVDDARKRLIVSLDKQERTSNDRNKPRNVTDLIMQNVADAGILPNSFAVIVLLQEALAARLRALKEQESAFWSYKHRPPNPYARAIALRVAKLYAAHKREKPTVGTARDGGHPSTAYTRALEEIYSLLEIKAKVRGPAKWAVEQLTDEDFMPPSLVGHLGGLGTAIYPQLGFSSDGSESLRELLDHGKKGSGEKS
jgi:hypothetical protein